LSQIAEGEVLLPVWWRSRNEADPHLKATFPKYRVGNFCYHQFLDFRYPRGLRLVARFAFYIWSGLHLHRENKIDVIMSYGTNLTGIASVVLKWLTGAKLIVQLPNVPENAYRYYDRDEGTVAVVKRFIADLSLKFVCSAADCLNILYPWQLHNYPRLQKKRHVIFPSFVPLHTIPSVPCDEKFILLVGYPWYTKGVDILIRAFVSIAAQFPDWKLKILCHIPDRADLEKLTGGSAQVEFLAGRHNMLALKVIAACSVFVLASRTDAAPVVIREAMAARKPIIASNVGGVAYFVRDNETGLLFESGNVEELAAKLTRLLADPELRTRLAARAYEVVMSEFDESAFVRFFEQVLASLTGEVSRRPAAVFESEQ